MQVLCALPGQLATPPPFLGLGAGLGFAHIEVMPHPRQTRAERIESILRREFAPSQIAVSDDSARHSGHAGAQPEGETHYTVLVVSPAFRGLGRLARHRAVHAALVAEFGAGLHALTLLLRTPEEQAAAG